MLMRSLVCAAVAAMAAAAWGADPQPAWPQENGPFGNFNPRQYGVKLVDDPKDIKMVWVSEEHDLGMGRAGTGPFGRLSPKGITPGSSTGLIVAEGKVFASSSVPRGDVSAKVPEPANATAEQKEQVRLNSRIDADDFTVAIDTKTGKTVWKSVEAGKGINVYPGKRGDLHNTPAYFDGKIFSLGTTGLVYCYDAGTGKKLWEDDTGSDVPKMKEWKAKCLKEQTWPEGRNKAVCPVVAGGVLVVPEYTGSGMMSIALRGMDVSTGKTLWRTAEKVTGGEATPGVWTHDGKQYLVVGNLEGELRMIEPKEGKVLWKVAGLAKMYSALVTSEKHVFAQVRSESTKGEGARGKERALLAAYRITPGKAERAWVTLDEPQFQMENHKDDCSMRNVVVRDGVVYAMRMHLRMNIYKEDTGEVLYKVDGEPRWMIGRQCWAVEDRLLVYQNPNHKQNTLLEFWTLDPKDFRQVGADYWPEHARPDGGQMAAGYDVHLELPYAEGFFYMRGYRGTVICYDLRKH